MEKGVSRRTDTDSINSSSERVEIPDHSEKKDSLTDRWLARRILSFLGDVPVSLILKDGSVVSVGAGDTEIALKINDSGALPLLLINPEYYFGELYAAKRIEVEGDLIELLNIVSRSRYYEESSHVAKFYNSMAQRLITRSSLSAAQRNIHHHYDIGNDFYTLWLDKEMQYTCAYFENPEYTLEQAQIAKMHHVCRKLMLKPGQTVVEAGCGWGGLARFMAREYGVKVKAYNISKEQLAYARDRSHQEGLKDQVEFIEDDYRNIRGDFDVFVSIGMLEHVGIENYQTLGMVIRSCLKENGMGLIHSIGRNRPAYMNPWIATRIFPGARPPAISEMMDIFEPHDFSVLDLENLRLHYAKTLRHWLSRFESNHDQIKVDYDDNFIRTWRLYLAGSISAFLVGNLQLFQVVFTSATNNDLPWSRSHLYQERAGD